MKNQRKGIEVEFRYDHVHYLTRDVRAMADFFENVFDLEMISYEEDFKGAAYAILKLGEGDLRIRGYRPDDEPDAFAPALTHGLDHLGVAVDDVEASVARLVERGAKVDMAPVAAGVGGRMIAFIKGPENIRVEICERPRSAGESD